MIPFSFFASPLCRRALTAGFFVFLIILLSSFVLLNRRDGLRHYDLPFGLGTVVSDQGGYHKAAPCEVEFGHLRRSEYKLTRNIVFQRRCFRGVAEDEFDREVVASVQRPLLGQGHVLNLDKQCPGKVSNQSTIARSCEPIPLNVPSPFPRADLSDTIFGVATTHGRLQESIDHFSHWLSGTRGQLLAILVDENLSDEALVSIKNLYKKRGVDLLPIRPWNSAYNVNEQHFTVIRDLVHHAKGRYWGAIIDDDTFFPSPYPIERLLKSHDPTMPAYLGGLSENLAAVDHHGFMGFGGAGVFLSKPLLAELEPNIENCMQESGIREGDRLLKWCIYNKTQTKFTNIPGLHQFDMGGDMSGYYESGQFPLSMHHWKSWHHAPVDKMAKVVGFCGGCFLQRWRFDSDTVFSNGYSISVYENGTENLDLSRVEATWDDVGTFKESVGPMRDKVERGRKKSYHLIDAERVGVNLRQLYVHRPPAPPRANTEVEAEDELREETMDEVVEVWWEWPRA